MHKNPVGRGNPFVSTGSSTPTASPVRVPLATRQPLRSSSPLVPGVAPSCASGSAALGETAGGVWSLAVGGLSLRVVVGGMVSFEMNDRKKIGLGLTGFGVLFSFLGIIMLFDKGFLAMGNILFVSGVLLTIGLKPTVQFFTKPKNHKGSISFGFGFFLVLIGWPALGMMVESYGFIMLFSGFWPTAAVYLQKSPSFGWIFHHPFVTSLITRFRGRRVPV
ncbi:vesicle transport protein GOT1-like isoform X1 [Panicum virgatum]|nr:vesicle transport protein GOT1-like isoform X1 [Panicum virgatum]